MNDEKIPAVAEFYPPSSRDVSIRNRLTQMSAKASFGSNVDKVEFHAMLAEVLAALARKEAQIAELRLVATVAATRPGLSVNMAEALSTAGAGEPLTEAQKAYLSKY